MSEERFEVQRRIAGSPEIIFDVSRDPPGNVAINRSGMLMSEDGDRLRSQATPSSCTWTGLRSCGPRNSSPVSRSRRCHNPTCCLVYRA